MYGDAVGTKVSGRIRQCGRSSGVAVKRGSTVYRELQVRQLISKLMVELTGYAAVHK